MSTCVVGIDNGLDGGLVAIDQFRNVVEYRPMPTIQAKKREIDFESVGSWVTQLDKKFDNVYVALEEPLHAAGSSQSLRSMAISFGQLWACLHTLGFAVKRIEVGEWQTRMLPRGPKGTSKIRALTRAKTEWPEETWIPPRCRTPHDGVVDAALIALYFQTYHLP